MVEVIALNLMSNGQLFACRETKIAGVAGFNVTKVIANIISLKVELGISFPVLEIAG